MQGAELIPITAAGLREKIAALLDAGGRMQMAYAWYPSPEVIELRYLAERPEGQGFVAWRCRPDGEMPSLAEVSPLLSSYEREITDLFGLRFSGQPQPERLVLHEGIPAAPGPHRAGAMGTPPPPFSPAYHGEPLIPHGVERHRTPSIDEPEVQLLPFGPVRAGVLESVEFLFFYLGERIIYYQPSLFFKHRGMEKRFEGRLPDLAVVLAERISGVGSFAHALAYCQAVEAAAGAGVPPRARYLRVLLAELERLYNHLHYLGFLSHTTTLNVGAAEGELLEERVKQINARVSGSRFLRSVLTPGGLRRDLAPLPWLAEALAPLKQQIVRYTHMLEYSESHLDRLITNGPLPRQTAIDEGATGPIARGSGIAADLRTDHPYAAYSELRPEVPVEQACDGEARQKVRIAEIHASLALIDRALASLRPGPVYEPVSPVPGSEGLGWAESPRGALFYAVHIGSDGRLARVKIASPSFSNWRVFPLTVHVSNMMDYAINEASFGLTISGCDR